MGIQRRSQTVCQLVQLSVCIGLVLEYCGHFVCLCLGVAPEDGHHRVSLVELQIPGSVETVQDFPFFFPSEAHLRQIVAFHQRANRVLDALGKTKHHLLTEQGSVVVHLNPCFILRAYDVNGDGKLRHVKGKSLHLNSTVLGAIVIQHTNLIGIGYLGMEVVTAGDTRKGVVLVLDGVREALRHPAQEICYLFMMVERCHKRECLDEHSHGVPHLYITSSI